ncbi:MAG: tagaturonate epimerase family protein [Chloroflexi bacterium]|nr:tagaturonate epimerase family protein [Chloroflexota bacterium]
MSPAHSILSLSHAETGTTPSHAETGTTPSRAETGTTPSNLNIFPRSLVDQDGVEYALAQTTTGLQLVILADPAAPRAGTGTTSPRAGTGTTSLTGFEGECSELAGKTLLIGPCNPQNAAALRARLDWLQPGLLGLRTSAGMGDRVGLATPGHVRAVRATGGKTVVPGSSTGIAPIFAQQSIREMTRTGRTPQQVMDDATWGIFQEGWHEGVGADADHLKTTTDIDACMAAGFTFFTIDPGAHVDNRAETASLDELRELAESLPANLQPRASGLLGKGFDIEGLWLTFGEATLLKAVVKYGKAVAHVASMYNYLVKAAGTRPFELEVSVDETDQPTSHAEHLYITSELKRLGVKWVSLAPRYVGRFEKGVDYIGDVAAFETDLAGHAAIARQFGPYKLSLHSGSDKFSIYPAAMRQTRGLVHLKTAGTSYLEALRTIGVVDVDLFREIYSFARQRYETDKASYHVSAELGRAPLPEAVTDWPGLLDQFDAREILHVTFGSVLTEPRAPCPVSRAGTGTTSREPGLPRPVLEPGLPRGNRDYPARTGTTSQKRFYDRFMAALNANPEAYASNLEKQFIRHLKPFSSLE